MTVSDYPFAYGSVAVQNGVSGGGPRRSSRTSVQSLDEKLANLPATPGGQVEPMIYLGRSGATEKERTGQVAPSIRSIERRSEGRSVPLSEALSLFYEWDEGERREWGEYLVSIGRIDEEDAGNFQVLKSEWVTALEEAAQFSAAGKKVSPWDSAKLLAGVSGLADQDVKFNGTKSYTRKERNLANPADARELIREVVRDQIGRAPTEEEYQAFLSVLNEAQQANPSVVTDVDTFVNGEAVSTDTTTQSGIGSAGLAGIVRDQARQMPDYGAYQAATRLWNSLLNDIINAPV